MIEIIDHAFNGLRIAHKNMITHLDLKPENIFLGENNMYLLGDWGAAKQMLLQGTARNMSARLFGTKGYSSMEFDLTSDYQEKVKGNFFKIDTYGLGMTIFVLAGVPENEIKGCELEVTSLLGSIVKVMPLTSNKIHVSDIASGMYIFRLKSTNSELHLQKVIIQ